MGRISRLALTPWHDYILQSSPGSRFPILKQTPYGIAFRCPGGEVIAHVAAMAPAVVGPGTFADIVADATSNYFGSISGQNAAYATARSTSVSALLTSPSIGQARSASSYTVYRGFLAFPTNIIGPDATVTAVTQTATVLTDNSTLNDFDLQIVKAAWTPTLTANREANYDLALSAALDDNIFFNTAGIATDTPYTSGALNVAWINETAPTYYAYRSSRDAAGTAPGAVGSEYVVLYAPNAATAAYRPMLNLTYDLWEYTTQVMVEVDLLNSAPERRTTQVLVEADFDGSDVERQFSQELAEVDLDADTTRQFSQVLLEVDSDGPWVPIERRVSQTVLEADVNADTERRVSQRVLEVDGQWVLGVERQISQHVLEVDVSQRSRYITQVGVEAEAEQATPDRAVTQVGVEAEIDLGTADAERRTSQVGIEWDSDLDAQRRTTSVGIEVDVEFIPPLVPEVVPPTLQTHQESIHLPVSLWNPRWIAGAYAPKDHYVTTLLEVEELTSVLAARGGYWEASWTVRGAQADLDEWVDEGLGRHVEVHDESQSLVWEGFVNEVSGQMAGLSLRHGPLTDLANRVYVQYTDLGTGLQSIAPAFPGTYDDLDSQARYGIWPVILQGGEITALEAAQLAQSHLADNAWPKMAKEYAYGGSEVSVSVSCVGYVKRLNYPYLDLLGVGDQDASTKIADILDADPNGLFSSANAALTENTVPVPELEDDYSDAWTLIEEVTNQGGTSYEPFQFGVWADRRCVYAPLPTTVSYRQRLSDPHQRVETPSGLEVRPWNVLPGRWLMFSDFLVGRVPPGTPLARDKRLAMLQQVTYTAPWGLQFTEEKVERTKQMVQQLALAGQAS